MALAIRLKNEVGADCSSRGCCDDAGSGDGDDDGDGDDGDDDCDDDDERARMAIQNMPTATCPEQVVGDSDAPSRFGCKRGLRERRSEGSARVCAPQC